MLTGRGADRVWPDRAASRVTHAAVEAASAVPPFPHQAALRPPVDRTGLDPEVLQAYAGAYDWGPDRSLTVIAQAGSLLLRFPDYRQHELFPQSAIDFYYVAFLDTAFDIAYEARFGLDEDRQVEYLELLLGPEPIRMDRLGPASFVPQVATPEPTATAEPTHTPSPTDTSTATAMWVYSSWA